MYSQAIDRSSATSVGRYIPSDDEDMGIVIDVLNKISEILRGVFRLGQGRGEAIENGVYIWEGDRYVRLSIDREEDLLSRAGYYLIYFHNNLCPSCRKFYPVFESVLRSSGEELVKIHHIRVVCDWFTSRCRDHAARRLFAMFNVTATPKLLLVKKDPSGSIDVLSDIVEDLGASAFKEKELSRALITLIKKNVSGTST